jgi:multiple sugar transport system permease protein
VRGDRRQLAAMLSPYLLGVAVLFVVPAMLSFALALTDADLLTTPRIVGVDNFTALADDPAFPGALWRSLVFVAIAVPLRLAVATGLALLLHRPGRGAAAARTAAFLPTVIPDAAYALVWLFLLNPVYGPLNAGLRALGAGGVPWLTEPWPAFLAVALMLAFTAGESFVVALAARQERPAELDEVARLEGAGARRVLREITLPLMAPVLLLLAARDTAVALQASFVPGYLLTDGGPDRATLLLPIYSFDVGFEQLQYGYASAMTLVIFALCAGLALLQYRIVRHWRLGLAD